ncbi:MAG: hypothetical protein P8X55_17220 [Desulfosarcinaceae bacterium]
MDRYKTKGVPMKRQASGNIYITSAATAIFVFTLLGGCAVRKPAPPPTAQMEALDRIRPHEMIEEAKQKRAPGPPPFSEQLVPLSKEIVLPPVLYSLVFDKAPLGNVIAALSKDSDHNLSIESDVDLSKPVTVNLKNVTLEEALNMIVVNGAGYAWALEDGTLYIKRFMERIYRLNFLDMVGETDIDVGGDMLGASVNEGGVGGKYQVKARKPTASSDLWKAVEKSLDGMHSSDGLLRVNRNAGVIYMADTPRKVGAMVRFLDSLSESLNRQVFIEARLPDVFELGFNGNGVVAKSSATAFSALLDFLKSQGDVKILSNPHLLVMNRQSALLTVGRQLPYTEIDGVDRDEETNTVTIGASIRRAILGLQLGITPQISSDGMITLHIVPTLTRVDQQVEIAIPTGLNSIQTISNPVIDLQELVTMVRVREGRSFVLAGLISKIRNLAEKKLPVLGDLPGLGRLFQHYVSKDESSELVILITPYIVDGGYAANGRIE